MQILPYLGDVVMDMCRLGLSARVNAGLGPAYMKYISVNIRPRSRLSTHYMHMTIHVHLIKLWESINCGLLVVRNMVSASQTHTTKTYPLFHHLLSVYRSLLSPIARLFMLCTLITASS